MSTTDLTQRIAALIEEVLHVEVPAPDTDLIDAGLIDSVALVELITEIEHELSIQLPLDEFDLDRFRSAEQIAAFVTAHAPSAGAA